MPRVELVGVGPTPPAVALARLRTFVSPFTGIVRSTAETMAAADELRLVSVGCELASGEPTIGAVLEGYTGSEHHDRAAAEAAALGEAIERYSASYVPEERLVLASAEALGASAVEPDRFALFSPDQYQVPGFPFRPFTRQTVVSWVEGFRLPGGEPTYLPAQLVYMPWREETLDETRIGHATSSGIACGATREEAVLTGLLEAVERDAFMLVWHDRLSLPLLDWHRDREVVRLDRRYFEPTGLRYAAVDLSVFLEVPTVLGVVHGPPGQLGALGVGAASAPTAAAAWRKALTEAFSVQRWVRDVSLEQPERLGRPASAIRTFDDHTLHYAHAERAARASFLDASPERHDLCDLAPLEGETILELIETVVRRLERHGLSAYAVDVTSPDAAEGGLHVAHVLVPELCPLDVVEGARFLGGRRLYEAAYEAGIVPRRLVAADLNPDPHPFP